MKILITGAKGFVGKNLSEALKNIKDGKPNPNKVHARRPFYFSIPSKSSAEISNATANALIYEAFGSLTLFSQMEIIPLETPTIFASCGCDNPRSKRYSLIFSPNPSILSVYQKTKKNT